MTILKYTYNDGGVEEFRFYSEAVAIYAKWLAEATVKRQRERGIVPRLLKAEIIS